MEDCTIIIFGATGDLSQKKLLPALYHLNAENRLTENTKVICMGRRPMAQKDWKGKVVDYVTPKDRGGIDNDVSQELLFQLISLIYCFLLLLFCINHLNQMLQIFLRLMELMV